ncbi:MAG: glycosyltransferase family 1 protein [Myxococcota bacterium]|nr:glycosyltransferase family 1 protein [Myxococcota bacterium]
MHLALDMTPAARSDATGVGRYARDLAHALIGELSAGDELSVCTRLSRWREHRQRFRHPQARNRWFHAFGGPGGRPDVFHGTDARLPERCRAALVATVHDVFSLDSEHWASPRFRARKRGHYAAIARDAERIVFDSNATQERFLEHYPETAARGRVVYLGVTPHFQPAEASRIAALRARYDLPSEYALYVGEISARKNLVNQARGLAASRTALPWVWVGRDSFGAPEIHEQVRQVPGVEPRCLGYVSDEWLPAIYSGASLLTFASHDEGFGFPALEAMACGTPAVVASGGAVAEVTGDAAMGADPQDPESIAGAIRDVVENPNLREQLAVRGLQRAARFSWQNTAREMFAVYRELVPRAS